MLALQPLDGFIDLPLPKGNCLFQYLHQNRQIRDLVYGWRMPASQS